MSRREGNGRARCGEPPRWEIRWIVNSTRETTGGQAHAAAGSFITVSGWSSVM